MKIHHLGGPTRTAFAHALAEFEEPFTYPLGPGNSFRISHGEDYTLFFRSQGEGSCFIARENGHVVGSLGIALRSLWMPNGSVRSVAYLADLKIAAEYRGGRVLLQLARATEAWLRPKVAAAFGIVMNGTKRTPGSYTGRAGIAAFREVGRVAILRISTGQKSRTSKKVVVTTAQDGLAAYQRLSSGRYACPVTNPDLRSSISPTWLLDAEGRACGFLEDTRKAKRLILTNGAELLSAHLSCFAYSNVLAGADLIRVAAAKAAENGFPGLFVAAPEDDATEIRRCCSDLDMLIAPATVYGVGLSPDRWNINTAEI